MDPIRKLARLIVLFIVLGGPAAAAANGASLPEPPTVFSHQDVFIAADRHVERLLVADADAVVAGVVEEGIIVVDGSLTVLPGARIGGRIVVLGGRLADEAGVVSRHGAWVVAPGGGPFARTVIAGLTVILAAGAVALPYLVWLVFRLLRRFGPFERLRCRLLAIQHGRPALYIGISLAVSVAMLVLFSLLAWQTFFHDTVGVIDNAVIWLVRYFAAPGLDRAMAVITGLGYGYIFGVFALVGGAILAAFRRWIELKGLLICLAGGAILNHVLKELFARARPDALPLVYASGFSFPSGHAMVSLCFYGMVAFLIARKRSWHGRIAVAAATAALVAAIGVSRVYLGVHYPSDVAAGYAAGATWLVFSISLVMWWEHQAEKKNR